MSWKFDRAFTRLLASSYMTTTLDDGDGHGLDGHGLDV
jgi:hypothetical protein